MNTPNPASVFGHRRAPQTPESSATPVAVYETPEPHKDDEAAQTRRAMDGQLGNGELPIAQYREQIVDAVGASQATVITAETGAGKSTQVPQFLAEAGYEVILTQPRVVAARTVSERIRDEIVAKKGSEYASFVGYRTARERQDSSENQILTVTDGLQLVRELSGNGAGKKQALVLDEVHEWNENMEVLVAWAKQRMAEDPDFKVVTMSATMEADKLSKYFANGGERQVPVIEVPGRTFDVKKSEGGDVADEAIKFARDGKNTLVFVPGKAEIDQVMAEVTRANIPGAVILPLHGQLEKEEQRKVFAKYPGVKVIVATNVAQTSITIEDIDAVVDSGLERQNQVKNGVEGLYLNPISQADCLQRAGRAGRTKAGEYVLAQLDNNKLIPMAERDAYGTPEILRTRLDGMVLRLAKAGLDPSELEFYNVERQGEDVKKQFAADIVKAKNRLQKLGALREDGNITKVGRDMDRMPVESHYARMMIEARKYGPEVQMQLAAMLAVQEAGGICQFGTKNRPCDERWRGLLAPDMNDSDAIKQLEVFVAAERMSDSQKRNHDIYTKAFSKAREVLRQLRGVEKLHAQDLSVPNKEQREQLVKCIIAGMVDNLYINDGYYGHRNAQSDVREVSSRSVVRPSKMVVGNPFDLQISTLRGPKTLNLLENPTNVPSVEVLREVAPQLFSEKFYSYGTESDGTVSEQYYELFNGVTVGDVRRRPASPSAERRDFLLNRAISAYYDTPEVRDILKVVEGLMVRTGEYFYLPHSSEVAERVRDEVSMEVANIEDAMRYLPRLTLDDVMSPEARQAIEAAHPSVHYGLPVIYQRHQHPAVDINGMSDVELANLPDEAAVLPGGSAVHVKREDSWQKVPLQHVIDEKRSAVRERAEQEARVQAEASGWLVNYGGAARERTGSNNQGWYVITPGGGLREGTDSKSIWSFVRPDEVAVSYWHGAKDPNAGSWSVDQLPASATPAQIEAVRELEEKLGMHEGAWDVEPTLQERKKAVVGDVLRTVPMMSQLDTAERNDVNYIYSRLMSDTGLGIPAGDRLLVQRYGHQWRGYEADEYVDGREAHVVEEIRTGGAYGVRVLAYHKYGSWQMALQLIEHDEVVDIVSEDESGGEGVTVDMLSALQQKRW